jgi:hypothetical protein
MLHVAEMPVMQWISSPTRKDQIKMMVYGFKSWKQPRAEMQGKVVYTRPKVVRPFPGPCASGSYVQRAALLCVRLWLWLAPIKENLSSDN